MNNLEKYVSLVEISFLALLIVILLIVGNLDYYDEKQAEQRYATMVCEGHWPDYKKLNLECS